MCFKPDGYEVKPVENDNEKHKAHPLNMIETFALYAPQRECR